MDRRGSVLIVSLIVVGLLTAAFFYFREEVTNYLAGNNSSNSTVLNNQSINQSVTNVSVGNFSNSTNVTVNSTNQSSNNVSIQLPDLIVDSFNYSSTFLNNDTNGVKYYNLELKLIVKNNGTISAGPSTSLIELNSLRRGWSTPQIASGETATITSSYENITGGSYVASTFVDWNYVVSEKKENNNGGLLEFILH